MDNGYIKLDWKQPIKKIGTRGFEFLLLTNVQLKDVGFETFWLDSSGR